MARCVCAPALMQLRDEVNRRWPKRDKASDGCCGDAAHAARKSDHNPTRGFAHALDIDEDIASGLDLRWLVPLLLADPRTKYVIYEALIFYRRCRTHGIGRCPGHRYTGPNAHKHHLHLSIETFATRDTRRWLTPTAASPAPTTEDDDMFSDHDRALLTDVHTSLEEERQRWRDLNEEVDRLRRTVRRLAEAAGVQSDA